MGSSDGTPVEILTRAMCLRLLGQASMGRIGVSIDALPVILPVHFTLLDETVLFRTDPGTAAEGAIIGNVVAFEADFHEPTSGVGWSVLLQGVATAVSDGQSRARSVPVRSWVGGTFDGRLVQVPATKLSGCRILETGEAGGGPGNGADRSAGAPTLP